MEKITLAEMQAWRWTDDAGRAVRLSDFRGETVVLSMFYQRCAGVCPLTVVKMQKLEDTLQKHGSSARFVLVTLDPRHDTPERLAAYRAKIGLQPVRWVLLTGSDEQTLALSRALGVHRIDDSGHLMHLGKIVLISADGNRTQELRGWTASDAIEFTSLPNTIN